MNDADWRRLNGPPPPASAHAEHVPDAVMPGRLSAEQEKHWQDCALCQRRVSRAAESDMFFDDVSDDEFAAAVAARLGDAELPVVARLPETIARSLFGPVVPAEVAASQVWQLRWQAKACLVAVVSVQAWHVTVAPVTTDTSLAGRDTVVVDAGLSPLQVPTAVWLSAATSVPLAAFARQLGALRLAEAGALAVALRAVRQSGQVGDHAPHGMAGLEASTDTLEVIDAMQASLAWFASADRALTDRLEGGGASKNSDQVNLLPLLQSLSPKQLAQAGLTRAELLPVLRGAPLSDVQAAAVAPILGLDVSSLQGDSPIPEALMHEASRPSWFTARHAYYEAHDLSDTEGLFTLAHEAQYALAARSVGPEGATDWRARVAYVLSDYLGAPDE